MAHKKIRLPALQVPSQLKNLFGGGRSHSDLPREVRSPRHYVFDPDAYGGTPRDESPPRHDYDVEYRENLKKQEGSKVKWGLLSPRRDEKKSPRRGGQEEVDLSLSPGATPRSSMSNLTPRSIAAIKYDSKFLEPAFVEHELQNREQRRFSLTIPHDDVAYIQRIKEDNAYIDSWIRFDIFFGLIVMFNGVLVGVSTRISDKTTLQVFDYIEYFLLCVYAVELILRTYFLRWAAWKVWWNWFDLVIITGSVIMIISSAAQTDEDKQGSGSLASLRMLRLLRIVRLLQLFRDLHLIVVGMTKALKTLVWIIITIGCLAYIGSIVMVEVVGKGSRDDPRVQKEWGSVVIGMYTLVQMTTYSGWADKWMYVTDTKLYGTTAVGKGYAGLYIFFIIYMAISAFGLMNLVIGIYVTSSMETSKWEDRLRLKGVTLQRHKAFLKIREKLAERLEVGPVDNLQKDKFLKTANKPKMRAMFAKAGLTFSDVETVFSELQDSVQISHSHQGVTLGDFIQGCLWVKGDIVPLDLLYLQSSLKKVRKRILGVDEMIRRGSATTQRCIRDMNILLEPHSQKLVSVMRETLETGVGRRHMKKKIFGSKLTPEEIQALQKERIADTALRCWARFDMCFMTVIIANAATIAYQTGNRIAHGDVVPPINWQWYSVEWVFWGLFCIEFYLRCILWTQLKNRNDDTLYYFFIPNVWADNIHFEALLNIPKYFQDPWLDFDMVIILITGADNVVTLVGHFSGFNSSLPGISVLRVLRLFKVLRIVRLLHRFKELRLLIQGIACSFRTLMWASIMILLIIYSGAIIMVEMVGKAPSFNAIVPIDRSITLDAQPTYCQDAPDLCFKISQGQKWATIPLSMFKLTQVATYDNWTAIVRDVADVNSLVFIFFIPFIVITNLMVMNLIVGVMVEAAFGVVRGEKERKKEVALRTTQDALRKAKMHFEGRGKSNEIIDNNADNGNEMVLTIEQLSEAIRRGSIMSSIKNAGLTADILKKIFEKLDIHYRQEVNLNDFVEACLRARQPVLGIDIVAAKVGMRQLHEELSVLYDSIGQFEEVQVKILSSLKHLELASVDWDDKDEKYKEMYHTIMADNARLRAEIREIKCIK